MIRISQIDDDLSIYKENKVIIWGANKNGEKMIDLFNFLKINILAVCDFDQSKVGKKIKQIDVISLDELRELSEKGYSLVIQEVPWFDEWERVKRETKCLNIVGYIMIREAWHVLLFKQRYDLYKFEPNLVLPSLDINETIIKNRVEELRLFIENSFGQPINVICTPFKTGDYTLMNCFSENDIPYVQIWNSSLAFNKEMLSKIPNKIRLFLGLRDPVSQNLSWVYQLISTSFVGTPDILRILLKYDENFFINGGDAQVFWDLWLKNTHYMEENRIETPIYYDIQGMLKQYQNNICDFTKYPFDKEKGYTIVKEGNFEIFIYQIEKLNNLCDEFSDFIGEKIEKFGNKNDTSDKWISDSYKQAKKDLNLSKGYFDKCYSEEYVKHCYSEEDVKKLKEKWVNNIKS